MLQRATKEETKKIVPRAPTAKITKITTTRITIKARRTRIITSKIGHRRRRRMGTKEDTLRHIKEIKEIRIKIKGISIGMVIIIIMRTDIDIIITTIITTIIIIEIVTMSMRIEGVIIMEPMRIFIVMDMLILIRDITTTTIIITITMQMLIIGTVITIIITTTTGRTLCIMAIIMQRMLPHHQRIVTAMTGMMMVMMMKGT